MNKHFTSLLAAGMLAGSVSATAAEPLISPERLDIYTEFALQADLSHLSGEQKQMLGLLMDAAEIMDELFWYQANGQSKQQVLAGITDPALKRFAEINYGPWDRLNGDKPFIAGVAEKPAGAGFYPSDMSRAAFESASFSDKTGLYSMVVKDADGQLQTVPYSRYFQSQLTQAAQLLEQAAGYAKDAEFANYLKLRAAALLSDNYYPSDIAWMEMKNNPIDLVIGPIENYEDQLFGYRASFEAYVLVKDQKWSEKLSKYAAFLPELQKNLPVAAKYKQETPGSDADLNAYDVIYYAGHSNAGSKTIAINLPNDERVQLKKGTRRLQLKNAMQAKFDKILVPIAQQLMVPEQRKHVTFDAFFANTMFHEVAHGLGIKHTVSGKGPVRKVLQQHASAIEEGKADILGLYMVRELFKQGEIEQGVLEDYYTTFMAGIFRSVRFGAASAHGKANMIRFNYFAEQGAFSRNQQGLYRVNYARFSAAVDSLSELILRLQGEGDLQQVAALIREKGVIGEQLADDLQRLEAANIPVDVVFKQGKQVAGL